MNVSQTVLSWDLDQTVIVLFLEWSELQLSSVCEVKAEELELSSFSDVYAKFEVPAAEKHVLLWFCQTLKAFWSGNEQGSRVNLSLAVCKTAQISNDQQ